jgi:hypothetical protein
MIKLSRDNNFNRIVITISSTFAVEYKDGEHQ